MRLAPDMEENRAHKNKIPDGQLGFEIPQMTQEVVHQLLGGHKNVSPLHWIDPRYAAKPRY